MYQSAAISEGAGLQAPPFTTKSNGFSPEQRVALDAQADGRFDALIRTGAVAISRHNNFPEPFILPARSAYAAGSFKLNLETTELDMLANTFMRAPGQAVGTFAMESAIDELAEQLGMDPVALRMRNEPEKDPTTGTPFSVRHIIDAYQTEAARFGWSAHNVKPGTRREGEWFVGMVCATYLYHRMPGGAARLTLTREGHATVEVAAHEIGMGTATTCVSVSYGDPRLPGVVLAGGSQQTASVGAAVMSAHRELVTELLKLAGKESPLAGLKPEEVIGDEGRLCKLDAPERGESYAALLARAGRSEITVEGSAPMPPEAQHWSMHSHGALRPSPSHHSNFLTSPLRPRNTKTWPENGCCWSVFCTCALSPSEPRRMSVTPAAIRIFVPAAGSITRSGSQGSTAPAKAQRRHPRQSPFAS